MTIITRITITPNARIIPPTNDAASNPLGSGQPEGVVGIDDMVVMDSVGPEESVSCVVVEAETDDVASEPVWGQLVTELMVSEEKFPEVVLSVGTIVWAVSVVPG